MWKVGDKMGEEDVLLHRGDPVVGEVDGGDVVVVGKVKVREAT